MSDKILPCGRHPRSKVYANREDSGVHAFWICGCDACGEDKWKYGDTREVAIWRWNRSRRPRRKLPQEAKP